MNTPEKTAGKYPSVRHPRKPGRKPKVGRCYAVHPQQKKKA